MAGNLQYRLTLQDQFTNKMNNATKATSALDSQFNKVAAKVAAGFGIGFGLTKLTSAVVSFGKESIEALSNYEKFNASLTTMLHGNVGAAEALNTQLVQLAKTTPFSLEDVQKGTKSLMAYGFAAGDITKNLTMLGNVASGVGAPLNDILYLYGTLRSSGRVTLMDIRQFAGRGIPIYEALQKTLHKTTAEILNMVSKGKIGFTDIETAFKSMTQEGGQFFNLMETQSKTVGGQLSNFGDSWKQLELHIAESQRGIIASTINMANIIIGSLDKTIQKENYYDKVTKDLKDDYKFNGLAESIFGKNSNQYGVDVSGQERKYFFGKNAKEQANQYATENKGTPFALNKQQASQEFSNRLFDVINSEKTVLQKFSELNSIKKEFDANKNIPTNLFVNESRQLTTAFKAVIDQSKLAGMKSPPAPNGGPETPGQGDLTGGQVYGNKPQNVTINITNLIKEQIIQTVNLTEAGSAVKDEVEKVLLEAINDINKITNGQ